MSMPPLKPTTAQAISDALFHQYGVVVGFVLITMTAESVKRAELLLDGKPSPDGPPAIAIANANIPQHVATAMIINAAEGARNIAEQAKSIEATKGNA